MSVRVGALWVLPLFLAAFILRTVAVLALKRRWPGVADEIDRWWVWAPFAVVLTIFAALLVIVTIAVPILGIAASIAMLVGLYFLFFTASSVGSPFRPRRQ